MKGKRKILIAFLLNLCFSVFEIIGGIFTGSVAIVSDAVHDMGDACSIGISYFLEKKSTRKPDRSHTYGYGRYSVLGGIITTCILIVGSVLVTYNAIIRWIKPVEIRYDGMIIFAVVGVIVNGLASLVTREGKTLNQRAVNLHMLEDVLGWAVVLVGAVVMRFTGWLWLDSALSIGVAVFIFMHAVLGLKEGLDLFLLRTPKTLSVEQLERHVLEVEGVCSAHHIHVWSIDGNDIYATMHLVLDGNATEIKRVVKEHLYARGVSHVTLETESLEEQCLEQDCPIRESVCEHENHHHHHHHHH